MKKIIYSAPGKVILSGEHAVVYGKPALVSAIDLRLKFSVWEDKKLSNEKNILFISNTIKNYLKRQRIKFLNRNYSYKIESQIPVGRGLGSSAALSVAAAASFLEFYAGKKFSKVIINQLAYLIEKYFHETPSGVDNSVASYGGLIYYRKEFEFLKNISSLNFNIPSEIGNNFFLIDTGRPDETTMEMVQYVKRRYENDKQTYTNIFNNIEIITKLMTSSLKEKNIGLFIQTIKDNQKFLEQLGVVSNKTTKLLVKLKDYGIGKISGAGGKKEDSGFLLFYSNDKKGLVEFCTKNKLNLLRFNQSSQGLTKEL